MLESYAEFQRFQGDHPLREFLLANPHKGLATLGDVMTDAQLLRSKFYREYMAPRRERFSAVLAFRQQSTLRALIGATRLETGRNFSSAELRILKSLHWHISEALKRLRRLQRERNTRGALELVLAPLPLPIVALDWELNVLFHNRAADECASLWIHGQAAARYFKPTSLFEMPADVAALCSGLKAAWSHSSERKLHSLGRNDAIIVHPTIPGLRASGRVVHLHPPRVGMPLLIIFFENPNRALADPGRAGATQFSQFARLSVCEREVAALVCKGESNKEIAAHLGKSVLTVKTQLQSIYGKLGNVGRGRLASLMLER